MAITCSVLLRLIPVRAGDIKAISRYSVHPSQMSWYTYIMFKETNGVKQLTDFLRVVASWGRNACRPYPVNI